MLAGLQVLNDYGTVQIDDTYRNLKLVARGSYRFPEYGDLAPDIVVTNAVNPCVAVRLTGTTDLVTLRDVVRSGSSWTFRFCRDLTFRPAGSVFEWYVFDNATVAGSTYGLQVFDASGRLVYDALEKWLRLETLVASENYVSDGYRSGKTVGHPASKKYAVLFGGLPYRNTVTYVQSGPGGTLPYLRDARGSTLGIRSTTTGVYAAEALIIQQTDFYPSDQGGSDVTWPQMSFMLVDVTDY